jgi:hypothetical protein
MFISYLGGRFGKRSSVLGGELQRVSKKDAAEERSGCAGWVVYRGRGDFG